MLSQWCNVSWDFWLILFVTVIIKKRLTTFIFVAFSGLIDYNFHCFRKAIHEVFEVGVSSQRPAGSQAVGSPCNKAVALNGTPRNTV